MLDFLPIIALTALTSGAYQDWKGRTVTNQTWTVSLAVALPFLVAEPWTNGWNAVTWRWASAALVSTLAFLLWYGKQWGAGDAKAVMVSAILLTPFNYLDPMKGQFIPALDAFLASLIIAEAWRRLGRMQGTPFLVILAPVTALTLAFGGLLWQPIVWLSRMI